MNSGSKQNQTLNKAISCDRGELILTLYLFPIIFLFGLVLNIVCTVIFYRITFQNTRKQDTNKMFEIYFYKSLNYSLVFLSNIFSPLYYCSSCESRYYLVMQIWYIVFHQYFLVLLGTYSAYLEILATLDRFLIFKPNIKERISILKSKHFYRNLMIILFIFCIGFYTHRLLDYKINSTLSNNTYRYEISLTGLSKTDLQKAFKIIHTILRDIIGISLTIIMSIIILKTMRIIIQNKKLVMNKSNEDKISNTEKQNTKMVVITNIVFIIGRTPICIYNFLLGSNLELCLFYNLSRFFLYFSYSIDFFIYLGFNKKFRNNLHEIYSRSIRIAPESKLKSLTL